MKNAVLLVMVMLVVGCAPVWAQEIEAVVSINADQLSFTGQQEVASFADDMQRYINTMRWTDADWEGPKIHMNFNVIFTGFNGTEYTARMVMGSQRTINKTDKLSPMIKVLDESWNFQYVRNQPFVQDPVRYDALTGLVDFYVYTALGLDLDSYGDLGGRNMYDKALTLANRAQVRNDIEGWSTQVPSGNYSRYGLIHELTDLRFAPIRTFIFNYHFNGLDLLSTDRKSGLDSINNHLTSLVFAKDRLVQPSVLMRVLTDAKYTEFAELFTGYPDDQVWRKLLYLDPGHQTAYEAARGK